MDGAAAAMQNYGVGKRPGADLERADADLVPSSRGDPGIRVAVVEALHAERATDEHVISPLAAAHAFTRLLEPHVDVEPMPFEATAG